MGKILSWTSKSVAVEAKKYKNRTAFKAGSRSAFEYAKDNHLLNYLFPIAPRIKWTDALVSKVATDYPNKNQLKLHIPSAYQYAYNNNMLDKLYPISNQVKWTVEKVIEEASKYSTRTEFSTQASGASKFARLHGLIDSLFPIKVPEYARVKRYKGLYLLYNEDVVVYVGKSLNDIGERIRYHSRNKEFTNAVVYEMSNEADIHILEMVLISKYSPMYNEDCNTSHVTAVEVSNLKDILAAANKINIRNNND